MCLYVIVHCMNKQYKNDYTEEEIADTSLHAVPTLSNNHKLLAGHSNCVCVIACASISMLSHPYG